MKTKIIATLSLMVAFSSFGQGLIAFQNANFASQRITTNAVAAGGGTGSMTTAANSFQFQLFYGSDALSMTNTTPVYLNSTTQVGIITGTLAGSFATVYPGATSIFAQAFGWTFGLTLAQAQATPGAFWGSSTVINPSTSTSPAPGTPLFGSTPSSTQFGTFALNVVTVPEPSTLVLAGLGAASLLLFRRRKLA